MSDEKGEFKYIQFPLCLLRMTYHNPFEGFNSILNFGIVHYSKSFTSYDIKDVAKQLMYCYYRDRDFIQSSLLEAMELYIESTELTVDEDYNGFICNSFDAEDSIFNLLEIFAKDEKVKQMAITFHQLRQVRQNLSLTKFSTDNILRQYEMAVKYQRDFEAKFGTDVMPTIKATKLMEARNTLNNLDYFRAYIAIKSTYGRNLFSTSNKIAVLARMLGLKSKEAFEFYTGNSCKQDKNLLPTFKKYSQRYHMDNLLLTMAEMKYIMFLSIPKVSHIYFSRYMQPMELADLVKGKKTANNLKDEIKNAALSIQ